MHSAGFGVVELDGQGGVGDDDGQGVPGVSPAEAIFCPPAAITVIAAGQAGLRGGSDDGGEGPP